MDLAVTDNHFSSFDGTSIRYLDEGQGEVLLLANGFIGSFDAWRHLVAFFGDRCRLVGWDYRGLYGSSAPSEPGRLRVQDQAADALALVDELGIESFVPVCWSTGVQIGFEIYRSRPDAIRALVLMCGTYGRPFETAFNWKGTGIVVPAVARAVSRLPAGMFWLGRSRGIHPPGFIDRLKKLGFVGSSLDEELFLDLFGDFGRLDPRIAASVFRELGRHDATELLTEITVPTLVIAGDSDHFTPRRVAEKMVRRIPDAELTMVPGGTHFVPLEHPELVNLRIEKFLCDHQVLETDSRASRRPLRASAAPAA